MRALLVVDTGPGFKNDEARAGWNETALKTAERFEKDGLTSLRGQSPAEAAAGRLAEGATTASALLEMARARGVEMPIAAAVEAVIAGKMDVRGAVGALLARPAKAEG